MKMASTPIYLLQLPQRKQKNCIIKMWHNSFRGKTIPIMLLGWCCTRLTAITHQILKFYGRVSTCRAIYLFISSRLLPREISRVRHLKIWFLHVTSGRGEQKSFEYMYSKSQAKSQRINLIVWRLSSVATAADFHHTHSNCSRQDDTAPNSTDCKSNKFCRQPFRITTY